ncbi:MAG TPA: hypothetical protein VGF56_15480 [Rhizomicrobium sp.]|jgi:hypothetical protein
MRIATPMLALLLAANAAAAGCPAGDKLIAPCFALHGRLQAWNGNPTFRIWRIGTRRVLGVEDNGGQPYLPPAIRKVLGDDAFGKRVTADYRVCPLTKARKGWMQIVCVMDARNITLQRDGDQAR